MEVVSLPSKITSRMLKRQCKGIAGPSKRTRYNTTGRPTSHSGSDSEGAGLDWRPVTRPAGALLGAGLDDDGGLLAIEEIDDVDVEYIDTKGGGRIAKLKVSANDILKLCFDYPRNAKKALQKVTIVH